MDTNGTKKRIFSDLMPVIIVAVLFLVILILVVFSAVSYGTSVDIRDGNNNKRAVLSYITTAVRSNAGDPCELTERDGIEILVLDDGQTGFERQIYFHDGKIKESYLKKGSAPVPDDALTIGETSVFEMEFVKDDLLEIKTDIGTSYVHIMSRKDI